jgi:hypothetical protein
MKWTIRAFLLSLAAMFGAVTICAMASACLAVQSFVEHLR